MPIKNILFDGGSLMYAPNSPPALQIFDLLHNFPEELRAHVAFPGSAPAWLPTHVQKYTQVYSNGSNKLVWEQRVIPKLASELGAAIHLSNSTAPLITEQPLIISPTGSGEMEKNDRFSGRLRRALGRGGSIRANVLWPKDVPPPPEAAMLTSITPALPSTYTPKEYFRPPTITGAPDLPDTFFLVHIPADRRIIQKALEAWTWAAGPIGEVYPLLFLAQPKEMQDFIKDLQPKLNLPDTVLFFPAVSPSDLYLVYQTATAVFHPAPIGPWSSPLRYGMACGKPVVALETAISSSIAGAAAYLIPPDDLRGLGAALISVIVRDDIRKQLTEAALQQSKAWSANRSKAQLRNFYLDL